MVNINKQYQKQFIQQQRTKYKISKQLNPRKKLIHHRQYTPKLGICKNKYTKKDPGYLIKLMKQYIKGNHHQAMPIQRNNLPCKPKEITSKEKLRSENQFLKIKLANQLKLVRQQLSQGPAGSKTSCCKQFQLQQHFWLIKEPGIIPYHHQHQYQLHKVHKWSGSVQNNPSRRKRKINHRKTLRNLRPRENSKRTRERNRRNHRMLGREVMLLKIVFLIDLNLNFRAITKQEQYKKYLKLIKMSHYLYYFHSVIFNHAIYPQSLSEYILAYLPTHEKQLPSSFETQVQHLPQFEQTPASCKIWQICQRFKPDALFFSIVISVFQALFIELILLIQVYNELDDDVKSVLSESITNF
ncbi:Hypothetical_protein [Hexamita inflata]|uniref:Hypothetical_protein n=1 Tax=Hexamita inflata TaxID=28002 RepID=A0AA86V5A6_9EUKA|nr:Hypothetical protein HINF_LOCUS64636 [Hexamita inflata]